MSGVSLLSAFAVALAAFFVIALAAPLLRPVEPSARIARLVAIGLIGLSPLAALFLYLRVGSPGLIEEAHPAPPAIDPAAIAGLPDEERRAVIESMVARLAARLEAQPADAAGWRMLARSQLVLQRPVESAASYRRLFALEDGTLTDWRDFAAALVAAFPPDRFPADPEFLRALDEIEKRAPGDPVALYLRGRAALEAGDSERAVALWTELLASVPPDAPIRATLEQMIDAAERGNDRKPVPE
jgi:cytochrome c-type biogenesis protein CcmH